MKNALSDIFPHAECLLSSSNEKDTYSDIQALGSEPETRNPKLQTRKPKPEARRSKPETRDARPETLDPKFRFWGRKRKSDVSSFPRMIKTTTLSFRPSVRNPKPETRTLEPETRNSKPETRNSRPEFRNPKPQTYKRRQAQ